MIALRKPEAGRSAPPEPMRSVKGFFLFPLIPKRTRGAEPTGRFYSRVSAGKERYQYPDPWVGKGRYASRVQGLPWGLIPFILILLLLPGCTTPSGRGPSRQIQEEHVSENSSEETGKPAQERVTDGGGRINPFLLFKEQLARDGRSPLEIEFRVLPWKDGMSAACSLTFDDGTLDQYTHAFPLLQRYGIKGTFYLLPGLIEEGYWQDGAARRRLFSWQQAREIAVAGHEIGSHGMYHQDLRLLAENGGFNKAAQELGNSAQIIRRYLASWFGPESAVEPLTFSWPFWRYSEKLHSVLESHYLGARAGTGRIENYQVLYREESSLISPALFTESQGIFQIDSYAVRSSDTLSDLEAVLAHILDRGGWGVLGFHGFVDSPDGGPDVGPDGGLDGGPDAGKTWVGPESNGTGVVEAGEAAEGWKAAEISSGYGPGAEGWDPLDLALFERLLTLCKEADIWIAPFREVLSFRLMADTLHFSRTATGSAGLIGSFTSPYYHDYHSLSGAEHHIDILFRPEQTATQPRVLESNGTELPLRSSPGGWYRVRIIPDGREYAFISGSQLALSSQKK